MDVPERPIVIALQRQGGGGARGVGGMVPRIVGRGVQDADVEHARQRHRVAGRQIFVDRPLWKRMSVQRDAEVREFMGLAGTGGKFPHVSGHRQVLCNDRLRVVVAA